MQGELRIELRGGEHAPSPLVVLPPGVERPASLPDDAVVVQLAAHGPEVLRAGEPAEVVATTRWTFAGTWRVRAHVPDDPSSVVDLTSWGSPELRVLRGPDGQPGRTRRLPREDEGELSIGRSPECDLPLEDNSVSRRHARVVRRDRKYYLEDLWSKGGTFLGEERIAEARLLRHQDRIRVGKSILEFYSLLDALVEEEKPTARPEAPREAPQAPAPAGRPEPAKPEPPPAPDAGGARLALTWENGVLALLGLAALAGVGYLLWLLLG